MTLTDSVPEIMRPPEAAELLRISVGRLAKMRLTGDSPEFVRAGRSILYTKEAIERWLADRVHRSTSDGGRDARAA